MKALLLPIMLSLSALALSGQEIEPSISPQVQIKALSTEYIDSPQSLRLIASKDYTRSSAISNLLSSLRVNSKSPSTLSLTIGLSGDKSVRLVQKHIPAKAEGYYLSIDKRGITIAGRDERGLYYGLQTLRQMMSDGKLSLGSITDYPDVPYRGVVEGFYGTPWSFEDRLSQLDFYGRNKLNVYIYGPKDDPYHSTPSWRKPYPEQEARQISALVERAKQNSVIFYWAIHPGQDINWNEEDRSLLIKKFEAMYQLGVRGFAVFFDDISGEGTKADKQAELLNYIDDHFIKPKGDIAPLIMCPTEYNRSWSNIAKGYLPTLGEKLNQGIEIMWTGNKVVDCLDKPDVEWINSHIKRKAYVWFNFPVSDFVRDHLLMGKTYGNSLEIASDLSGFLSNPMEHAESSKIALYSVADYTWNMKQYNADLSWEKAMKAVFPEDPDALHTFAKHSSALGANGHRFDRKESEELQPTLDLIIKGSTTQSRTSYSDAVQRLYKECRSIQAAANVLLSAQTETRLTNEMKPWLQMAKLVGEYGEHVVNLSQNIDKPELFRAERKQAVALQRLMYTLDTEVNQNPYQPGVKYGTQWLLPAINALYSRVVQTYNATNHTDYKVDAVYLPFTYETSVALLQHQPLSTRGKQVNLSPSNEVIKWNQGDSLSFKANKFEVLKSLTADLGIKDGDKLFRLEVLTEGKWQTISLVAGRGTAFHSGTHLEGLSVEAIRLTYVGEDGAELRLRSFRLLLQ